MVVIARTDPHATYDDVQAAHPDWIAVDADGQAAPALGVAGDVGDVRARALQLRVHDRGEAGDHVALPRGRHLHQPLGRLRACATASIAGRISKRRPASSCRARTIRRTRRAALTFSGGSSGSSICGGSGTREVRKINPDSCVIPNTGGGATSSLDMKRIGELAPTLIADRQARRGLTRAVGQRQERQGIPRRPWAANPSSASSASASRNRIAGRTACRARPRFASGSPTASPTACGRGSPSSPACCTTSAGCKPVEDTLPPLRALGEVSAQRSAARARRPGLFAADRRGSHGGKVEDHTLGWYQALIEARIPFEMVHDRLARRGAPRPVQDADPAEHRRAVRRAMRAAPRVRASAAAASSPPTRRAFTTNGACGERTSAWPTCSASPSGGRIEGPMQNSYLRLETRPAHRPAAPAPGRTGRRAAHHQRRAPRRGRSHAAISPIRRSR